MLDSGLRRRIGKCRVVGERKTLSSDVCGGRRVSDIAAVDVFGSIKR
jgi:hypothetical protein